MASFNRNDGTGFLMSFEVHEGLVPETIVFSHGNLASNRWWYPSLEEWKKKAKGKNYQGSLVFAEWRGCGKSTAPLNPAEINMHTLASDYVSLIKYLNLGKVNIVGHSTGGIIALLAMYQDPSLFKKAVLLDPVGAQGVKFDDSMTQAFEMMKNDKELVATVMNSTIHNNDPKSDFFRQVVVEDAHHAVKTIGVLVLKALDGLDIRQQLSQIQKDVLVLHGEYDLLLPVADSQALARLLPHGEFATVQGRGHCANAEDPKQFTDAVDNFLFHK